MEQFSLKNNMVVSPRTDTSGAGVGRLLLNWLLYVGLAGVSGLFLVGPTLAADGPQVDRSNLLATVQEFAQAVANEDDVAAGQRDFVCLFKMKQENKMADGQFPDQFDPVYDWCAQRRRKAHEKAIEQRDRALDAVWPGKGQLVNFADFQHFFISETGSRELSPSFFVMHQIAVLESTMPFTLEEVKTHPLPHASFRYHDYDPVLATPTTMVTTRVTYPNPSTAPISDAKGTRDWVVPYKKPQGVIRSVHVNWVVLSDLKKLGFPMDHAVLDIPLEGPFGTTIPFVIEAGGYVPKSTEWWGPGQAPEALQTAVDRAKGLEDSYERIMLLNRVLLVDPNHQGALETLSNQLYKGLLAYGERIHGVHVAQDQFNRQFNELYWTVQSQTDRFDLTLQMEMGGNLSRRLPTICIA